MTAQDIASDILLGLAVVIVLGASVGVLVMRDPYQKLHYVTPAALVAPVHQVLVLSIYGVLLAVLFLAFQAPDVTLSELAVGSVALPVILLLALAKVRKREE